MQKFIFDIETDGIKATKIHCLSYYDLDNNILKSLIDVKEIKNFIEQRDVIFIAHNGVRYDIPIMKRLLGANISSKVYDTLPLSWTLYPKHKRHGLEEWGEQLGVKKPEIKDWEHLSIEEYIHRCEEDVKINTILWRKQYTYLMSLYNGNIEEIDRYCSYLSFKMDCVREQEEIGVRLDIEKCKENLANLSSLKETKIKELSLAMPKKAIEKKTIYENAIEDENGNIFQKGDLFFSGVSSATITKTTIKGWEEPNPNSHDQIKDWLYSLGWVPENLKHVRDKETNETKKIPQIGSVNGQGEICNSIKKLFSKEPKLELLDGLFVLSHRISIFEGFLKNQIEGRLYPTCVGLTNTLRLQHGIVVNLPGFTKKYGKEIRSCLIADDGCQLVNSDLSGIEDNTKRHYIYKYDPEYVNEMSIPGYDPHLELAVLAGYLTKEQAIAHKEGKEDHKIVRAKAKVSNFALTYKSGVPTIARQANIKESEARKLYDAYWKRNKAILEVEKSLEIKEFGEQKWLKNPISGFWYTLRNDKDKFSTLNQSSAVYVFDLWLQNIRKQGQLVCYQCHDEWLANTNDEEKTKEITQKAINKVNAKLKLNIEVKYSIAFGNNYYDIH